MPETVVIDFVGNTDNLQTVVPALEQITSADAVLGAEVKKTTATFADRQKALDQQNKSSTAAKLTLDQLSSSVRELNKNVIGNASTKQVEQFATQMGAAVIKSNTLTTQLRALREQLSAMETAGKGGTKAFQDLAVQAGRLQDQIGDTAQRIRILASDTKNLDAALSLATGLAGAFAIAQGASALFGKENENVQKALLKVQSALAILNGLQAVATTLNKTSAASVVLLEKVQSAYAIVVGTSTGALKAFRVALASTGIGLFVIGLSFLISKLFATKEATDETTEATSKLNTEYDKLNAKFGDAYDTVIATYEAQRRGVFDLIENFSRLIKAEQTRIELARIAGATTTEIAEMQIHAIGTEIEAYELLSKRTGQLNEEDEKKYRDLLDKKKILTAQYLKYIEDATQKSLEDIVDAASEGNDQLQKATKTAQDLAIEELVTYVDSIEFAQDLAGNALEKIVNDVMQQQDDEAQNFIDNQQKKLAELQFFAQQFSNITNALFQFSMQLNQNEIDALEDKHKRGLISEKEYRRKQAEFQRKAAIAAKELAMFNIVINTATAIISALAEYPPNIPLSIGVGVTGALELAAVASRQLPSVPQFAKGTEKVTGGKPGKDSVPAILMPGERIVPADINAQLGDIPNADLPKLLGVYPDLPYISNASMDAMEKYRGNSTAINYDLLGKSVAKYLGDEIKKHPKSVTNVDRNGFTNFMIEDMNKKKSLDDYYSSKS